MSAISEYREPINAALATFFESLPERLDLDLSPQSSHALELLREFCLRPGKRIRGSLAAFSYDHASKSCFGSSGLQLGVAFELIQSYFLIIDDVMDRSKTRRGEATIHELYGEASTVWAKDAHTTNMLAINVGLIAQHLANSVITELPEDATRIKKLLAKMHRNISGTTFGQIDDLVQQIGETFSQEDILRKYLLKSSYYTYISPLQAGLTLGGVEDNAVLDEVDAFGRAAGIAFQLHDDYLGVFGQTTVTGKSNLDDLQEGKYTLLVQYALEHTDESGRRLLESQLGNEDLNEVQGEAIRNIFVSSGAKDYLKTQTKEYAVRANEVLHSSKYWGTESAAVLEELVNFTLSRQS